MEIIKQDLEILKRDDLALGGFAGLKEHRLVVDERVGGGGDTWDGIGNFVYLADAKFLPHGETRMHPHREIDVISVMVDGQIAHEGSLEHGQNITTNQVQVQRAGGEGFKHNEINPDDVENRMIQLWVLPENKGECAGYKSYDLNRGNLTRIYGGNKNQDETFDSSTIMDVGLLGAGDKITVDGQFMAYITRGSGKLNGQDVTDGDLLRGENLQFEAANDAKDNDVQLIVVSKASA